jgi:hypothetical protein
MATVCGISAPRAPRSAGGRPDQGRPISHSCKDAKRHQDDAPQAPGGSDLYGHFRHFLHRDRQHVRRGDSHRTRTRKRGGAPGWTVTLSLGEIGRIRHASDRYRTAGPRIRGSRSRPSSSKSRSASAWHGPRLTSCPVGFTGDALWLPCSRLQVHYHVAHRLRTADEQIAL